MNKYILIIVLIIILVIICCVTYINNYKNKELFEVEQELNSNQESPSYSIFIIFGVIVLCLLSLVIYYFNTVTPIPELIQKKQSEQLSLSNSSDSLKPYIIIVQPSIVPMPISNIPVSNIPVNQNLTQPDFSNSTNPITIPNNY